MEENKDFLDFLIKNIKIYKNPTKEKFINLITTDQNFCVRALVTEKDIFCWKGSLFTHNLFITYLQKYENLSKMDFLSDVIIDKYDVKFLNFLWYEIKNSLLNDNIGLINVSYIDINKDNWLKIKQNKNLLYLFEDSNIASLLNNKHE